MKFGRRVVDWVCGTGKQPEMTAEQEAEQMARMTNIKETKRDKMILNISAVLAMGVSVFFWAYYG